MNPATGTWKQVTELSRSFKIMGDLVINHCSVRSFWFENYLKGSLLETAALLRGDPARMSARSFAPERLRYCGKSPRLRAFVMSGVPSATIRSI